MVKLLVDNTTTAFAYTGDAVQENTAVSMQCFWNERKAPMQSTAKQNQKCRMACGTENRAGNPERGRTKERAAA